MKPGLQKKRLSALRSEMVARGLNAFLIPRADEHQNEYVPPSAERLKWISGFKGTAGLAVVGLDCAAMFVDGRYTLQVQNQCASEFWHYRHLTTDPFELWLKDQLSSGDKIGFDPKLHTEAGLAQARAVLEPAGLTLVAVDDNLVDRVWPDQPSPPIGKVFLYDEQYCGEASSLKRHRIAKVLKDQGLDALVISSPDNLAWLFNIRGSDLELTPVVLGFAMLSSTGQSTLFLDPQKLGPDVRQYLEQDGIVLKNSDDFEGMLSSFTDKQIRVDKATASVFICDLLKAAGATVDVDFDPCTPAKALKNTTELNGIQNAHIRDGVALVRFFNWFKHHALKGETEWTASQQVAEFREQGDLFKSLSFDTISAAGANGAIVHFGLEKDLAITFKEGQLYLLDSGGQYLDGTTDVTRVLALGTPSTEMVKRYTQVLKGHIAVSAAKFPKGTKGADIDPLARQFLLADGLDYDHGTGHGVGCYLSVHEGPQSISKRGTKVSLKPGMVLSIEPGYYKAGAFGIRIESLAHVIELDDDLLGFKTLTLAPFERCLIDTGLLDTDEINWIDAYHKRIRDTLTPRLNKNDAAFLAGETKALI